MTAPDVAARVTAWLDRLEGLHTAATPGPWKHYNPTDGQTWWYPRDAAAIVAEHNAMGSLLALARGVTTLAEELDREAARFSDVTARIASRNAAARLRRLLADAAPDTAEETA